jgi:hypothetical protein
MSHEARKLLVLTGPSGRTVAVSHLPAEGRFVADDISDGRRLGDLNGDLMPFLIAIDDAPHIVFAGVVLGPGADQVDIVSPGIAGIHQTCHVRNQVWMTFPEPFTPGVAITATWRKDEKVLFEIGPERITPDALEPLFGPDWTRYAPL